MTARSAREEIERLLAKLDREVGWLADLIEDGPDNPVVNRLSRNAFTIKSSDLGGNWSAAHHDHLFQYRTVAEAIRRTGPENALPLLGRMIKRRSARTAGGDDVPLADQVVKRLRDIARS